MTSIPAHQNKKPGVRAPGHDTKIGIKLSSNIVQHSAGSANVIIPIRESNGRQTVSGRDLHSFLGQRRDYTNWFKAMVEYGFTDGQDFTPILAESTGGRPSLDHALTLDMAKELAMIQRTPKGKQARQYFIEVEKRARDGNIPQTLPEALRAYASEVEHRQELEAKVEADAPKVLFADAVSTSRTDILVGDLAKILRGNGVAVGANRLFGWLRDDGFLIKREGSDWNMPTQRSMELGLFRIKETAITHSDGHVTVSKTPKVTGKGQTYFVNRFLNQKEVAA